MIEFLCPNGHKVSCQAEQAGKAAKCPRCGVKFRIPNASELGLDPGASSFANLGTGDFIDSSLMPKPTNGGNGTKEASQKEPSSKKPEIEFLCPNGHRLHGPSSLQGHPGQCPECGSRFRIPVYEDVPTEETPEKGLGIGHIDGSQSSSIDVSNEAAVDSTASNAAGVEPMSQLVARLWAVLPKGTVVEIGLRNGETFTPHRFLTKASRDTGQGVFTVSKSDGSIGLTAVAWAAIDRISVRGLKKLPAEWAELPSDRI